MYIKNKRGQSTVEYILLVTAVVAVMIAFTTSQGGLFQTTLTNTFNTVAASMNTEAGVLADSHAASAAVSGGGNPPYTVAVAP